MGAPAGAGGSDRSDEKKVDTYSNQLKTIQKKKSKTTKDKFGYTVPKKNSFVPPSVAIIKGVFGNTIDKANLNRRMKFANKNNINLQGLSTEQILSKDFKSQLDAKGYSKELELNHVQTLDPSVQFLQMSISLLDPSTCSLNLL